MPNQHLRNRKSFFGRSKWRNSTKTLEVHPLRYYVPKSLQDLLDIVQEGIKDKIEVRAVGSGHSYSQAPKATEILIDTDELGQFIGEYKHSNKTGHFFEVESGIKVKALNKKLDNKGFCISAMGAIDHQSIAGAISTGTHGSSHEFGTMSNMVKSMVLVTHDLNNPQNPKAYRLEPTSGITDKSQYPEDAPELIQEDDTFYCALLGFGCFGIIYSYVLEVEDMYYLSETKKVKTWEEIQTILKEAHGMLVDGEKIKPHELLQVEGGNPENNRDHVTNLYVQVNPYKYDDKQNGLIVTHVKGKRKKNLVVQRAKRGLWHSLKRKIRAPLVELLGVFPYVFWITVWTLNRNPQSTRKQIDRAVRSQRDELYYNKGYRVMHQGLDYVKERAYDCEFAVPLANGKYLDVINDLMKYLQYLSKKFDLHISSPLSLRFVKASPVYLDPAYREDVCYIDCPVLLHIYGAEKMLENIQEFVKDHDYRPHWGKRNELMDEAYLKTIYPKFEEWKAQHTRFNPLGVFSNDFSRQMVGS